MPLIDKCVSKNEEGTFDFQCPVNDGTCVPPGAQPFQSTRWPTSAVAKARGLQHFEEHKTGVPMPDLDAFRADQGLSVNNDGKAVITAKDL